MVTGQCLLPVSLAPTWSSTHVLLDTVHVPSTVMLVTPPVCTPTLTVTLTDNAHVIEKVCIKFTGGREGISMYMISTN